MRKHDAHEQDLTATTAHRTAATPAAAAVAVARRRAPGGVPDRRVRVRCPPAARPRPPHAATAPLNCAPPGVKQPPCYSPRPIRWPTASRRCSAAGSTAAARPWSCPNSPKPRRASHRHPQGPGHVRQQVRPAPGQAARSSTAIAGASDALPRGQRGSRGHRDGARDRARRHPRRGPGARTMPRPAPRTSPPRDQGDPRRRRPARRGDLDQRQRRRALLHPGRGGPHARGAGAGPRPPRHGRRLLRRHRRDQRQRPAQCRSACPPPTRWCWASAAPSWTPTATGAYLGEMAWNGGTDASGGGYSSLFPRPAYQDGVARTGHPRRPRRGRQRRLLHRHGDRVQRRRTPAEPRAPAPPPRCGRP